MVIPGKGFLATLLIYIVFGVTAVSQAANDMDERFAEISEDYFDSRLRSSPVSATKLGDHRFDHLLDQVDAETRRQRARTARAFLAKLDQIAFQDLSRENQVDFSLLKHGLRKEIWEIEQLEEWNWNPLIYSGLPGNSLYTLMSRDTAPVSSRLKNAASRCREFPRFFEQARDSLSAERTPRIHAETAVDQNRGILKLIDGYLVPHLDDLAAKERADLESAIEVARAAIEEHQVWLENELLPHARGEARLNEDRYREKFAFTLFSRFSPEELRARAVRQLADLHDQMYDISKSIYASRHPDFKPAAKPTPEEKKKLIRSCLEFAYAEAPSRDGVVDAAYHSLKITTDFVREKDLVTLPEDPLEIILMPEFRRGVSLAYCDAPGPLDSGQRTFYAVSPPPKSWSDEQVDSFLREYNLRSLHNLTIHEAMPGHYVQLAHANQASSRLRSILPSGTFIEGWAVYTEWMMVEEGFLADDPLMKLIVLKWYLRDVTNALLDQMIHLDGIGEKAAMDLMMNEAFQEEREAAGKYRRAQLTSAQLSTYYAGYREVLEMREAAEKARGDDFDLKAFHDGVMSFGSPPPAFVRALLLDEPIAEPE